MVSRAGRSLAKDWKPARPHMDWSRDDQSLESPLGLLESPRKQIVKTDAESDAMR